MEIRPATEADFEAEFHVFVAAMHELGITRNVVAIVLAKDTVAEPNGITESSLSRVQVWAVVSLSSWKIRV